MVYFVSFDVMEPTGDSNSRSRDIASWPSVVSHYMLECVLKQYKSGKGGDNGLKKEQFIEIADQLKEKLFTSYDCEQVRNHFRIWKQRLRALSDLQKQSGLGWNASDMRFDAPQHFWNDYRKKEQKYWKEHSVLPIHLEVGALLRKEMATGNDSTVPSEAATEVMMDVTGTHVEGIGNNDGVDYEHIEEEESVPSTPIGSTSRSRGRPRGSVNSGREKRKKGVAEKVVSPLKQIANSIEKMVMSESQSEFGRAIIDAVDAIPDLNFQQKFKAKEYFMAKRNSAIIFLGTKVEDRRNLLEMYLPEIEKN
ncbi:uncharacterized protein LOC122087717 [Macadamia integrifolia]|uniref:uncharacterized protein LOC122087717 n=2 Tax=Macadamia integrifolia TaxID=60698 RepID=UPI001C4EA5B5|nr:uncharacterized protein LOC122087717 [Macadamia integrifolia]